ncbi:MAG TPA: FGGY family carbohydrate kinase [bacterium]|nr:FGGY family carbohydrate kinase [bacterium]HQI47403.1 FGGY family carbohydrate kinase [bacterium]HQJ63817.1 FGGY family carbohydrate kinase [bacterium]
MLFAGLDSSTQGCKLIVLDLQKREVVHLDAINYDSDLDYGTRNGVIQGLEPGASESDPAMWIEAIERLFGRMVKAGVQVAQIRAISVSGQQHGLVTLDAAGHLSRPRAKLWNDFSTEEECRLLTAAVGGAAAMIDEVGNSQRTGYTAAKIYHMVRHEPDLWRKTATCFLVHNYVNWWLTGGAEGGIRIMEPGDLSGMALWHPGTGRWSKKVLNAIAPDLADKLPPVRPSDESIGTVGRQLVERFGFDPGCRVDAGCGDNMYSAIGTGNVTPGLVTISLGTSGTAYTVLDAPFIDASGEIAAFRDSTGRHFPLLCVSNLANGYNALIAEHGLTHAAFNDLMKKTPAGNEGRMLLPWYMGERTPDVPLAAPVYFGFSLNDFTVEKLGRAVLEGHILNLYDGYRKMPIQAREIRLTGGLSQSPAWCQAIADIFESEVVPVEGEGAALGAALHAAWVYEKENGRDVALTDLVAPFVQLRESMRKKPLPDHVARYQPMKRAFAALSARVRGIAGAEDPFAWHQQLIQDRP